MNNKKKFITIALIILAIILVIIAIIITIPPSTTNVNNTPVSEVNNNEATIPTTNQVTDQIETPAVNEVEGSNEVTTSIVNQIEGPAVNEILDVEKIDTQKELTEDDLDMIESDLYTIPKTISEIELMSDEEKIRMDIDPNLVVQVLGRLDDGRPSGYRFITNESDILLDTR